MVGGIAERGPKGGYLDFHRWVAAHTEHIIGGKSKEIQWSTLQFLQNLLAPSKCTNIDSFSLVIKYSNPREEECSILSHYSILNLNNWADTLHGTVVINLLTLCWTTLKTKVKITKRVKKDKMQRIQKAPSDGSLVFSFFWPRHELGTQSNSRKVCLSHLVWTGRSSHPPTVFKI